MTDKINKLDLLIMEDVGLKEIVDPEMLAVGAAGVMAGATALSIAGIIGKWGYKAYQRYLSDAGRACAGKSFADRTACIAEHRRRANAIYLQTLEKGMSKCGKADNPEKCKASIQQKINKIKQAMNKA